MGGFPLMHRVCKKRHAEIRARFADARRRLDDDRAENVRGQLLHTTGSWRSKKSVAKGEMDDESELAVEVKAPFSEKDS
jgi:hypothetical protein